MRGRAGGRQPRAARGRAAGAHATRAGAAGKAHFLGSRYSPENGSYPCQPGWRSIGGEGLVGPRGKRGAAPAPLGGAGGGPFIPRRRKGWAGWVRGGGVMAHQWGVAPGGAG